MTGKEYNEQFSQEELVGEIWKDIPDWEGYYQVSNLGRVKSLERVVPHAYSMKLTMKERLLKPSLDKRMGCPRIAFCRNGILHSYTVHRLVLLAFAGVCPEGMECCHNDGKEWNNRLINLRWDTHKNNINDQIEHGTTHRGENQGSHKLTEEQVTGIKELYGSGLYTQEEIGKMFSISGTHVSSILCNRCWSWFGKKVDNLDKLHCLGKQGQHNGRALLSDMNVIEIRELYTNKKYTQKELSRIYHISDSSIYNIVHNISWKHLLKEGNE